MADGKLGPAAGWLFIRGLLISAMQTYAAICLLLSKKRPQPLMLQATILGRSLYEILTTVMAVMEDIPARTNILLREYIKMLAVAYRRLLSAHGADPEWADYFHAFRTRLEDLIKSHDVPPGLIDNPNLVPDEWPTPGRMLKATPKTPSFVSGTRHAVLRAIYDNHYAAMSAQAHARMAAISMAMLVDTPEMRWNPGQDESNIVSTALLHLACLLTEIEAAGGYPHHPRLDELWSYLREGDGEAQELWLLRYDQLTGGQPRT